MSDPAAASSSPQPRESVYSDCAVLAALRETLQELTEDSFIKKEVSDRIQSEAVKVITDELSKSSSWCLPECLVGARLQFYRFHRHLWTMCIDQATFRIRPCETAPSVAEAEARFTTATKGLLKVSQRPGGGSCWQTSVFGKLVILKPPGVIKIVALDERLRIRDSSSYGGGSHRE